MPKVSCNRRCLCPSCHQKRAVAFGQWVLTHILLADLSRCGWQALKPLIQTAVPEAEPEPGAVVATQSFGDFPECFHPHLHILATYENEFNRLPPAEWDL